MCVRWRDLGWVLSLGWVVLLQAAMAANPSGGLRIEISAAPNFVVDSNVQTPATYGPRAAYIGATIYNDGTNALSDVFVNIGNYNNGTGSTPGLYPSTNNPVTGNFTLTGTFAFTHEGGSLGTADATRYVASLAPGSSVTLYWLISYPVLDQNRQPVFGANSVFTDDLTLNYDIWATGTRAGSPVTANQTKSATLRNEISAMANKIFPNTAGKVPIQYQQLLNKYAPSWDSTNANGAPGTSIQMEGVWYDMGNVNQGYDVNGDLVPDTDCWMQPVGDPSLFDAGCLRLAQTHTLLVVKLKTGGEQVYTDTDKLYYTGLPENNGVVGYVRYDFLPLNAPCSMQLTPYQEAASGKDNEKFNGDFGSSGVPPTTTTTSSVTLAKSSSLSIANPGQTNLYTIAYTNAGSQPLGNPLEGLPLVIQDKIPTGVRYVAGSATSSNLFPVGVFSNTVLYSTNNGVTWLNSEPVAATNVTDLQWWLSDVMPTGTFGAVRFAARVNSPYPGPSPMIVNTGRLSFGSSTPFLQSTASTLVTGTNRLGDTVFVDNGGTNGYFGNKLQEGGEAGLSNVLVSLYWDANANGVQDAADLLLTSAFSATNGGYLFTNLPDARYVVMVNTSSNVPVGYTVTTPSYYSVDLDSGGVITGTVAVTNADFGFAPPLLTTKSLTSSTNMVEGRLVTYSLSVSNALPGNGTGLATNLVYSTWGKWLVQADPVWSNPSNAVHAIEPDGLCASNSYGGSANDNLEIGNFASGLQSGNVVKVELAIPLLVSFRSLRADTLNILVERGPQGNQVTLTNVVLYTTNLVSGTLYIDITAVTNQWTMLSDTNTTVHITCSKGGPGGTDLSIDAVGFRITTDVLVGGGSLTSTVNPVPLTDTFNASFLQFLSATVPPTTVSTNSGTFPNKVGTLFWDNLGPLYPGGSDQITVTFKALEPFNGTSNTAAIVTNIEDVTLATFANGRSAGAFTNRVTNTLNPAGVIGDYIWRDANKNGTQDVSEVGIPNVQVVLTPPSGVDIGSGVNVPVTNSTDINGYYLFEGLPTAGVYVVTVLTNTLPGPLGGATNTFDLDGNKNSSVSTNFNPLVTNGQDRLLTVDFGYFLGTTIDGWVWNDINQNATNWPDTGEPWMSGVRVLLYSSTNLTTALATNTTSSGGYFSFTGSYTGNYVVVVSTNFGTITNNGGWVQSYDSDMATAGLTNKVTITNVQPGSTSHALFSYYQSGTFALGDMVFYDWNGNGTQNTNDEGIAGVPVYLYYDANSNGVVDAGVDVLMQTATTLSNGFYQFSNLATGNYMVVVDQANSNFPNLVSCTADPRAPKDGIGYLFLTVSTNNQDFGYQPYGNGVIGDTVWRDLNGDRVQSGAAETGVTNVLVSLYVDANRDGTYVLLATTNTDSLGQYRFTGLADAPYQVVVDATSSNIPRDALSIRYGASTATSTNITILNGNSVLSADFGFAPFGAIGDTIFWDYNANGSEDGNEGGISNVTVRLYDATTTTVIQTTTTSTNGQYLFSGLSTGRYVVVVVTNAGVVTNATTTADPDSDGAPYAVTNLAAWRDGVYATTVGYGTLFMGADFGFQPPGVIGDTVWIDSNTNGVFDAGELPIANAAVVVYTNGIPIATNRTDSGGIYGFGGLRDGTYEVRVLTNDASFPAGLVAAYDPDTTNDSKVVSIVISNSHVVSVGGVPKSNFDLSIDFGYRYGGNNSVSGTVGLDTLPYDGLLGTGGSGVSAGESPFANVTVFASIWKDADSNGIVGPGETIQVASTTTATNGDYSFTDLPGSLGGGTNYYIISLSAPQANLKLTTTNGTTTAVRVTETTNLVGETVSAYQVLTITNSVTNIDFAFRSTLSLDFGDLPSSYGTLLTDLPDSARHIVHSPSNLFLGARVDVEPNGQPSITATGDDTNGVPNDEDGVLPIGIWQAGASGGVVKVTVGAGSGWLCGYMDFNHSGSFVESNELLISRAVTAGTYALAFTLPDGAILTNGATQLYARFRLFGAQPAFPGFAYAGLADNGEVEDYRFDFGTIGDTVFRDWNGNGVQDSGEEGMAGVTVTLTYYGTNGAAGGGDDVTVTATTDSNGVYEFSGLQAGNYSVSAPAAGTDSVPSGYALTTGNSPLSVALASNQVYQTADFGYRPGGPGVVGDQVFKDVNGNAMFDAGDSGLSNITLRLYRDVNGDGVLDGGDILYASTNSGLNGVYAFANVATGFAYIVDIDQADPDLPAQFNHSYLGTTADPQSITNLAGTYTNADFGYFPYIPCSIGDQVFLDSNGDSVYSNAVDLTMAFVTVSLYRDVNTNGFLDGGDVLYATTQSSTNGAYAFTNLPASTYIVVVDTGDSDLPAGYLASVTQYVITLTPGENRTDADFPFIPVISKSVNKSYAVSGDLLTYSINLQYVGDSLLSDARLIDPWPSGITFTNATAGGVYTAYTPKAGVPGIDTGTTEELVTNVVADTYIQQDGASADQNFGSTILKVKPDVSGAKQRLSLMRFDLSGIPSGSRVISANLYANVAATAAGYSANVYRMLTSWSETGATWNTNGVAGSDWATGSFSSSDYAPTVYGPLSVGTAGWATSAVTALLQSWVDGGTSNRGMALVGSAQSTDESQIENRETAGSEAYLRVLYYLPVPHTTNALTVDKTSVATGGAVTVTMRLISDRTVTNVTPSLRVVNGTAAISGPAEAYPTNVLANTTNTFTFTCVPSSFGEVYCVGSASSSGGYEFVDAQSQSILVSIYGGSNVVQWSFGTNSIGQPGSINLGGRLAAIGALKGDSSTTDWYYTVLSNRWAAVANVPGAVGDGGALAYDGNVSVYALAGGGTKSFYRYTVTNDTWATMAAAPANVAKGGAAVYLPSNTTQYVYAFDGNATGFRRYNVAANTWSAMAVAPYTVKEGGALTTEGTNIFAFMGNVGAGQRRYFYRYNRNTNTWTRLADLPLDQGWGGALVRLGSYLYAFRGNGATDFFRYDIAGNTWASLESAPGGVGKGGALTTDGTYIYGMSGNTQSTFWRYNPLNNTWTTLAATPATVGGTAGGGALTYVPGTASAVRQCELGVNRTLVTSGTVVTVTMRVQSFTNEASVWPTVLAVQATNGAAATLVAGPSPASQALSSNTPATFTWTYLLKSGTNVGNLTFSGSVTNGIGGSFGSTLSPGVIVVPALQITAQVNTPATVGRIENIAIVKDESGAIPGIASEPVHTLLSSALGDRVWLDENADGVQDVGESGIANVMIVVSNTATGVSYTNWTDSNGGYLFEELAPGTYTVRVITNTLAAGLVANQTYDPDGTMNNQTTVTLSSGRDVLTADFGYDWSATSNVLNNTGTGAIGDRIWIDADGDGTRDAGEPGMGGVSVELIGYGSDGILGTADDTTNTTTTAANGSYIFAGLAAGAYRVIVNNGIAPAGYTETGDPDAVMDNVTTTPILLAPGDVYLNADFGYTPQAGMGGDIGDLVWLDASDNGILDNGDYGIPGVTVSLIRDSNGNGIWDYAEPIIATTVTATNGAYRFTGVPVADGVGTDDYLVWVNDTAGNLAGMEPCHDADGVGTPMISAVANLTTSGDLSQDFGFTVSGQSAATALIGDSIFLDRNTNGVFDVGEGFENVAVGLYDASGTTLLGSTVTDENGFYYFAGLLAGTYIVRVNTNSLPASPAQLSNTVDPDGGNNSQALVTVSVGQINLAQDFGYTVPSHPNTITGTIWADTDADGVLDAGETSRYAGVTVVLYTNGSVVAYTTSDANGNYTFAGLPDGAFRVDVTDAGRVLIGTWHTLGTAYSNNNSQADPLTVTLTGGQTADADFGYYRVGTALGNWVWDDLDADGVQDAGEPGLGGVTVRLAVAWPNGTTSVVETVTDGGGYYTFGNLLLDENFDGLGGGEPTFSVSIPVLPGTPSPQNQAAESLDSDNPFGESASVTNGTTNDTYDFGFHAIDAYTAMIGGTVYDDGGPGLPGGDNVIGPGDTPQPGVVVSLYRDLNGNGIADVGELVATDVTDASGAYLFTNMVNGSYLIVETDPAGATSEYDTQGSPTDNKIAVTIAGGADSSGNDFLDDGANVAAISGTVYDDGGFGVAGDDAFGGSPGDAGVPGVLVSLYLDANGDGAPQAGEFIYTTVTGTNGLYLLPNLPNGNYLVVETNPSGATSITDADGTGNTADRIAVTLAGTPVSARDFLDDGTLVYAVSGCVYLDANGDGAFGGDTSQSSVTVLLYADLNNNGSVDAEDTLVGSTTTDGAGAYSFSNVPNGNYLVVEVDPLGMTSITDHGEPDQANDANTIDVTVSGAASASNDFLDAAYGSIGDRVWLDENSDGIQDAGEDGIANVRLLASNTVSGVTVTNWTDNNGSYLFTGLPAGTYVIRVDTNTLAAGLAANQTYDPDMTTNHAATVTVAGGQDVTTADFGYNWATTGDVTGNTGTGAIGDRVWIDADGDGVQDPGEPGMGGIGVTLINLGADGVPGTADDTTNTTTTAADGSYVFGGLSAGAYQIVVNGGTAPANTTATGDPDGIYDSRTTTPIVLAPGDVYVNADFGYKPAAGYGATIGDTIWFDANADGTNNGAEYGIAGVTVALVQDANGNGVWDAGDFIIATTTTGTNGAYAFTGVPVTDGAGTDDYLVWVNDTAGVLTGLTPTYDANGISSTNLSVVANLSAAGNLLQDFGYTAAGQTASGGLIGDTIYLDRNTNGVFEAGEGMEGVTVRLYAANGTTLLGVTLTDENGHYYFGGLSYGTYVVKVDTNTLRGAPGQLTNTVDPDGGTANQSMVTINGAFPVVLTQDFGYADLTNPNAISGTLWVDTNASGVQDGGETGRWVGVTVLLLDTNGNVVATTTTDGSGNYRFTGVPDGSYRVQVTDAGNVLEGAWHTLGSQNVASNGTSKADPYAVTVTGGQTIDTVDFGYYTQGGALGNRVWWDVNGDGLQSTNDVGIVGVKVTLRVVYSGGVTNWVVVRTDTNGAYAFGYLLLDENLPASGGGAPMFMLSATTTNTAYTPTYVDVNAGTNDWMDSDQHTGVVAQVARGQVDMSLKANPTNEPTGAWYDFGYKFKPTLARLISFGASSRGTEVVVRWETAEERGTLGFWLERWIDGDYQQVNATLIPGQIFTVDGAIYEQVDPRAQPGGRYTYRLVEVETSGNLLYLGPYTVEVDGPTLSFDEWSRSVFDPAGVLNPAISGPDADPDGDGANNFAEFIAGTSPTNGASALRVTAHAGAGQATVVQWSSAPLRTYTLERTTDLDTDFRAIRVGIPALPPYNLYTDRVDTAESTVFYRIRVE